MSTILMRLFFALTLTLSTLITLNAARAFDEQSALKNFQSYAQENNIVFTFGSVEKTSDNSLIIKNADYYDEKTKSRQQIESITLGNIRDGNNGRLQYDSIEGINFVQKGSAKNSNLVVTIERVYSDGLKFSENSENKNEFWPSNIPYAEITNMTVESSDERGKSKLLFPSASVEGFERTSMRNFLSKSIKLSPGTGTVISDKETIAISTGAVTIENLEHFGMHGFDVGLIDIGAFTFDMKVKTGEQVNFLFEGFNFRNFFSPDLSVEGSPLVSDKDLTAEIKPLTVTLDGNKFMGWERGYGTSRTDKETKTLISEGRIERMYFDFTQMPDDPKNAEMLKNLKELDLVTMVVNLEGAGSWQRESGIIELSKYNIELEDGASFALSARVSGYTEELARQFMAAIDTMNAEPDEHKKNALAMQSMAYLAGLTIERMEIILDDQSLLDRVINVQAKKLKQEPEQIKAMVGPMTTIMMTPYNIPELAAQTSQALGTFMQGNKKLTITMEPVGGLAVTEIIALSSAAQAGSVTPADLAKRLNLTIVAE
jgi:hypothetical protein